MENRELSAIIKEIEKVIIGKRGVIEKILMAVLANGHILLDDVPGVGKTTLAVALGKVLGMEYHRIQFTPDVLPSDIVGFSIYEKESGKFIYMPGVVNSANLLLADEINRTSSRTQSALLEAMEEKQVTVDGKVHELKNPFIVIATQNQVGTAGTQVLPQAQLDRFLVKLTIGYPDKKSQINIIKERQTDNPFENVNQAADCEAVLALQKKALEITMKDEIVKYITELAENTRNNELIDLGVSPRGAVSISRMAKACAMVKGRDYVTNGDVQSVFCDVCSHRIILSQKAKAERLNADDVLTKVLNETKFALSV